MDEPVPPALVLGCNSPHGIGVLSDWIEEQTGHPPDFAATGWSDGDGYGYGSGSGYGYGNGDGDGDGYGYGDGYGSGSGYGYGYGY